MTWTLAPVAGAGCRHGGCSADEVLLDAEDAEAAEDVAFAAVHLPEAGLAVLETGTSPSVIAEPLRLGVQEADSTDRAPPRCSAGR
jgi:hypothetical protein